MVVVVVVVVVVRLQAEGARRASREQWAGRFFLEQAGRVALFLPGQCHRRREGGHVERAEGGGVEGEGREGGRRTVLREGFRRILRLWNKNTKR